MNKQRVIKFRAWDKRRKRMWQSHSVDNDGNWGCDIEYTNNLEVEDGEKLIQLQFTGLRDKNGKEIYEGDIFDLKSGWIDYVKYNSDIGAFGLWCEYKERWDDTSLLGCQDREVIGNIYENEDLLK